ncbi:hypothetical protein MNV49_002655 [Pseudohyphozyma bogoriensis]|nr:hypothetical protein MNV49_002655 [Pseudohyphozyma bogoriensis]
MEDSHLPPASGLFVDTRGAEIIQEVHPGDGGESSPDPDVYLPMHEEMISHIALDIGGSLAKVVYFTRAPPSTTSTSSSSSSHPPPSPTKTSILSPKSLSHLPLSTSPTRSSSTPPTSTTTHSSLLKSAHARRRSSVSTLPTGGRLNFTKFETSQMTSLISFLSTLISSSAASNRVPLEVMKRNVKIMATGGGAHKFYDRLRDELGVEVRKEEEMDCLVLGLAFVTEIPNEVFWYSDVLLHSISHPPPGGLPRPSPNPPQYSLCFDDPETTGAVRFPCLLVNIGSGVSILKVDDYDKFERVSGTSLGGGTLWGLLSLLTGAGSFDEMLQLADKGDNSSVDMLVGDIYGDSQDLAKVGLKSSTIASSFGKVFKKDEGGSGKREKKAFSPEDISKSLLYAISNNIGQIAYMNAEKYNLDRIYFGGGFIRGHASTISTLSYAIRFWSKGTKRAHFLRHEGYLGGIGAWLRNLDGNGTRTPVAAQAERFREMELAKKEVEGKIVNGVGKEEEKGSSAESSREAEEAVES